MESTAPLATQPICSCGVCVSLEPFLAQCPDHQDEEVIFMSELEATPAKVNSVTVAIGKLAKQIRSRSSFSESDRPKRLAVAFGKLMTRYPLSEFCMILTSCFAEMIAAKVLSSDLVRGIRGGVELLDPEQKAQLGDLSDPCHLIWHVVLSLHSLSVFGYKEHGLSKSIERMINEIKNQIVIPEIYRLLAMMTFSGDPAARVAPENYEEDYSRYFDAWNDCVGALASQNSGTRLITLAQIARVALHHRNMPLISVIIESEQAEVLQLVRYLNEYDPLEEASA